MQLKLTCPRGKIGVREAIFYQEDSLLSGTVCWNESGLAHEEYRRLPAVPERVQKAAYFLRNLVISSKNHVSNVSLYV